MKKYFIPHADNNYHPHILHTKRTIFYAVVCLAMKGVVFAFVLLLPSRVFLLPDVLEAERQKIIQMTNSLRTAMLTEQPLLDRSAALKTTDMAVNQYFDHVGPGEKNLHYFLDQVKYPYEVAGENLAMGFSTAEDVLRAWRDSPAHRANLLDGDFKDIGVAIEAGEYKGVPTVYIAQHFGRPKISPQGTQFGVLSSKSAASDVEIISGQSLVSWEGAGDATVLSATAVVRGSITSAEIEVRGYTMPLDQVPTARDTFVGTLTIPETPEELFKVITLPTLRLQKTDGTVVSAAIPWDRVLPVSPTPIEKYTQSKAVLGAITNIFSVQRFLYLGIFLFMAMALVLNIAIEIRKQHPHVIAQTMALLLLIAVLIIV